MKKGSLSSVLALLFLGVTVFSSLFLLDGNITGFAILTFESPTHSAGHVYSSNGAPDSRTPQDYPIVGDADYGLGDPQYVYRFYIDFNTSYIDDDICAGDQDIDVPGYHILNEDSSCGADGPTIAVSDVIFDCKGFTIEGQSMA